MDAGFLYNEVLGNTVRDWLTAGGVFLAVFWGGLLSRNVLRARLRALAAKTDFDQALAAALTSVRRRELGVVGLYFAVRSLMLSPGLDRGVYLVFVVVVSYRAAAILQGVLAFLWRRATADMQQGDATERAALRNIEYVLSAAVWLGASLFILENLGVNITTAVAGLGIGGIAVAMAAQQVLGDVFSSFVIFMDKPFRVGDFIVVDGLSGTVENVGIRTTQVRSLSGEMLVFANSDITKTRLRNYKRMRERRVVIAFGVPYDTPLAKAEAVPGMIRDAFQGLERVRFERAHLRGLGPSALEYEAVYYVLSDDYGLYMDIQQKVSLSLLKRFEEEGVSFSVAETAFHVTSGF